MLMELSYDNGLPAVMPVKIIINSHSEHNQIKSNHSLFALLLDPGHKQGSSSRSRSLFCAMLMSEFSLLCVVALLEKHI